MAKNKKQIVSLRLDKPDMNRIKEIAARVHSKEADVYRFALRLGLARLAPLHDNRARGSELIPVFAEYGSELTSSFNLDSKRLEQLFNDGVIEKAGLVSEEDLELIALSATPETYLYSRLRSLLGRSVTRGNALELLCEYLLNKYTFVDEDDTAES
ncbi:MAG TPA: hypothetical protein DCF45_02760 [Gammaproteobacteria bacterium]|nr:hypothetical protein [Gammaproteobacteria bacterium]